MTSDFYTFVRMAIADMDGMTPDERVQFFHQLEEIFCSHCGYEQPDNGKCQCSNDE